MPLSATNAQRLTRAAQRVPFGHGADTRVDEAIRKCWQIDRDQIGVSQVFVTAIGEQALKSAEELGLEAERLGVEASLYKLVLGVGSTVRGCDVMILQ